MPSHKDEIYYCEICGAYVEIKKGGDGALYCCGQAMNKQES